MSSVPARIAAFARTHAVFTAGLLLLVAVNLWRVRYGVDITDEPYYAVMPVSWLRSDGGATGNHSPHQYAAVMYSPLVRLYAAAVPDLTGLIVFLRRSYVVFMAGVAVLGYRFFLRLLPPVAAAGCGLLLLAFTPWGLPSLSYNTVALGCLTGGLLVLGRELLGPEAGTGRWGPGVAGAALLAVGAVAYPSLLPIVGLTLLLLLWLFPARRGYLLAATGGWAAGCAVLFGLVAWQIGGVGRAIDVFAFSRELSSDSWADKPAVAARVMLSDPWYVAAGGVLFALGVVRRVAGGWPTRLLHVAATTLTVLWWLRSKQAVFFARGHDLMTLLCLASLPLLRLPGRSLPPADRILTAFALCGLVGGLVVAASANNGIVNFIVLGTLTAVAGWANCLRAPDDAPGWQRRLAPGVASLAVAAALAWASLCVIYGEEQLPTPWAVREKYPLRVDSGAFAGIRTWEWKRDLLRRAESRFRTYEGRCRTIDFWTTASGLYLVTPFELRTPMAYLLDDARCSGLTERLDRHYAAVENRPDLVVLAPIYQDKSNAVQRVQDRLLRDHYVEQPAEGPLRIFLRSDIPAPPDAK